ncbi:hypothetical protein B7P34_19925 [Streptosporangium nondiastaticum]|uniref:Lipoprotein n=1 Tax=Streptosporangium nondiastaticum TaxID=35764 RepID=A0A9X7JNX0_9ACTN|nr:hypothetical protein [Streptosporangium nondiastaticum]PSJ26998.1 hypothetical protein B7P34_19925 [Streptosporangium nondiastaticum]
MRAVRIAAAVSLVLLAAGCGTSGSGPSEMPRATPTKPDAAPPPPDKGPLCDGDKDGGPGVGGTRILRGGFTRLPGGAPIAYAEATADGTHRKAVLAEGETPADRRDGQHWTVAPGDDLTVKGHAYTVRQICTYRVVLTPKNPDDTTPAPSPSEQGNTMKNWPTTVDGRWRLRWHVPDTQYGGAGYSAVLSNVSDDPKRADIGVGAVQGDRANYTDARVGDTLEIAGRLWKVEDINIGNMDVPANSHDFKAGYVDLRAIG